VFSVVASNPTRNATSSNAVLTVTADLTPPTLIGASLLSTTSISVAFSEAIALTTATNVANYRVTNGLGPNLTISSATLNNGTNVVLTVSPTSSSGFYTVVVNNIK